jgi:undecaprenyl diphosphate synthase
MKKFLLTISLLCCFQPFPSYGMEAQTPDNPAKQDTQRKDVKNNILAYQPKAYEWMVIIPSPPKVRQKNKETELDFNYLFPERGPASSREKACNSLSRPATPSLSPDGTRRKDSAKSKTQSSNESMSLSSTESPRNSTDSMSLNSSTDSLPLSNDELAFNIVTNPKNPIRHLAIIPDGNRRWAELRGVPNEVAYAQSALKTIPQITKDAFNLGVKTLTIWLFSTENWLRGPEDSDSLMRHFDMLIDQILPIAHKLRFKVIHLGNKDRIPEFLKIKIAQAELETANYPDLIYNLAIDSGGRDDLIRAVKKLAATKPDGKPFDFTNIDEATITKNMDIGDQQYPSPDLVIRATIGDYKTSGFMLWDSARYKLYFAECYAPDLKKRHLIRAIFSFADRERNFGK